MAKNNFPDFSLTAASNTDVLNQSTAATTMNANTLDDVLRNYGVILALFYDQLGGVGTVGGTADAITLATNGTYPFQSLAAGNVVAFKASAANTGAATINVDSLGAKAIRRQGDSALSASDIVADGIYLLRFDAVYNSAAGAWVLLNQTVSSSLSGSSTTNVLTGTGTSTYVTDDALAALWEKGSAVASASTVSLGEGGYFHITGTTTITDIDFATAKDGRMAMLVFDGALTLTHNATTLILPGAANITTAAGDSCIVVQDNSDNVKVLAYQKASGAPVVAAGSGITLLGTLTMTSGATQSLTGIASGYRKLYCEIDGVSADQTKSLRVALSSTNGAAYGSSATISPQTTAASDVLNGWVEIGNISSTVAAAKTALGVVAESGSALSAPLAVSVPTNTAAVVDAIQFSVSSGAFDAGSIRIYGEA